MQAAEFLLGCVRLVARVDDAAVERGLQRNFLLEVVRALGDLEARFLRLLTDADAVYLDWGKPTQRPLAQVTPELLRGMQFDAGSMGPKVAACREFVEACNGIAGIGALADGAEILAGEKGTLIRN